MDLRLKFHRQTEVLLAMLSQVAIEIPVPLTNVAILSVFWRLNLGMRRLLGSLLRLRNSTGQGRNGFVSAGRGLQRKLEIVSDCFGCIAEQWWNWSDTV